MSKLAFAVLVLKASAALADYGNCSQTDMQYCTPPGEAEDKGICCRPLQGTSPPFFNNLAATKLTNLPPRART